MLAALHIGTAVLALEEGPPDNWVLAWSFPVVPLIGVLLCALIYGVGFRRARQTRPHELPNWRAGCFYAGLAMLWIALASPIDAADDFLLSAHMIQHWILMSVAPPLIILGAPVVPMLRGLPRSIIRLFSPLFQARWAHGITHVLTHPAVIWLAMNVAYIVWHVPAMYDLTAESEHIHDFEHLCFFVTSLAFWWVVLAPWPARRRWPQGMMIPYLLAADAVNSMICAILTFSNHVLYKAYAVAPRVSTLTPLQDQVAAGGEMWVLNSIITLSLAVWLTMELVSSPTRRQRRERLRRAAIAAAAAQPAIAAQASSE